ncbi:MAG TPA: hypothetical protein VFE05_15460 [Longimicrobiaceae bacterium]|nr:hypothetical protein [Longimicrobiaceae bacterium]
MSVPDLARRIARLPWPPLACAALHSAAIFAMAVVLAPGTEARPRVAERIAYVAAHPLAWRASWAVWMTSALAIVAFYAWWAAHLPSRGRRLAAVLVVVAGAACDLSGEAMYALRLPRHAADALAGAPGAAEAFARVQALGTLLTAVPANALYTLAGVLLTVWMPGLPRRTRALAWTTWGAGAVLSLAGASGSALGMVAASAVLFPCLVLTCLLVGEELA